eukprot:5746916-Amphidinium_carterae.1
MCAELQLVWGCIHTNRHTLESVTCTVGQNGVCQAFAAYPNETCVHVHCQQDASVCPKTGRDFAESASVYGYALGQSATDVQ